MKEILLLAGDGIGPEIMNEARKVLRVLQAAGLAVRTSEGLIGGAAIDAGQKPLPDETLAAAQQSAAVLLAAVGGPQWDTLPREQRPERGLLALRQKLGLFANLRPVKIYPALVARSPLKKVAGLDLLIVRELVGGIYFGEPRGIVEGFEGGREAFNTLRYSTYEVARVAEIAFQFAEKRRGQLCSVDKMNVLESSQLWRETVTTIGAAYPKVALTHMLVDNAAMQLVRNPLQFDVLLTGNLFGDILSDEASMLTGSIGLLPSASVGENTPALYEPIHGSAPDLAGKNRANPIAIILSLAMLLRDTLAEDEFGRIVEKAVEQVLDQGARTDDLSTGEKALSCSEMGDAIVATIKRLL